MSMNFFRKKKKKKLSSVLYHPKTIALIGFVIISIISVPLWKKIDEKRRLDVELSNLKGEIERLSVNNNDLNQLIEYLKSDYFVEEQARLNLGLKKKGEEVFVIKNNNQENKNKSFNSTGVIASDANVSDDSESNTSRWLNYFLENK